MIYIFVFLGEFGYELLNWQGVIRKFSETINKNDKVICCSRANLYPLYEKADKYIDISEYPLFKNSVACSYVAMKPANNLCDSLGKDTEYNLKRSIKDFYISYNTEEDLKFDKELKEGLKKYIENTLSSFYNLSRENLKFIFSSERHELNKCIFGCDRSIFEIGMSEGDIYENINLENNKYEKISPDFSIKSTVEEKCLAINSDYILVQMGERKIVQRSKDKIELKDAFIEQLAKENTVILLNFSTGRNLDSYSSFKKIENCYTYSCSSFVEQAYLIYHSKRCLFFTQGDFRSHIYVPPMLGKDVIAVAPKTVYQLRTSPINFWNKNIFKFGGQILSLCSEDMFVNNFSYSKI